MRWLDDLADSMDMSLASLTGADLQRALQGTLKEGLEVCGSLKDKGRSHLTHSGLFPVIPRCSIK